MADSRVDSLNLISEKVIGAAFEVSRVLGHGFLEAVYRNALGVELKAGGFSVSQEKSYSVEYRGERVGTYVADLVVDDAVVVELKAVSALSQVHTAQLLNYLKASGLRLGLLVNFGKPRLEIKRVML